MLRTMNIEQQQFNSGFILPKLDEPFHFSPFVFSSLLASRRRKKIYWAIRRVYNVKMDEAVYRSVFISFFFHIVVVVRSIAHIWIFFFRSGFKNEKSQIIWEKWEMRNSRAGMTVELLKCCTVITYMWWSLMALFGLAWHGLAMFSMFLNGKTAIVAHTEVNYNYIVYL